MLGLIAGEGQLPVQLAHRCASEGRELQVCELEGFPSSLTYVKGVMRFRIEQLGSFFEDLKQNSVREVVFAGALRRPEIDSAAIDNATQPFVPRILRAIQSGDDAALRLVLEMFEEQGFRIRAPHEIMPDLLPETGIISARSPVEDEQKDAARGATALRIMSGADVGQAVVVSEGQVVAVEAAPGTDWMLRSLRAEGLPAGVPGGGVLVKAPKRGQDRRIDMPTIGLSTIKSAAKAGLTGIAIEAGGVMVLDPEACRVTADASGIALWVFEPDRCDFS